MYLKHLLYENEYVIFVIKMHVFWLNINIVVTFHTYGLHGQPSLVACGGRIHGIWAYTRAKSKMAKLTKIYGMSLS